MPNETGKHCYGSDSLQITENASQTVFPNQLISTKVFICNCCLVKAANLNRMITFLSKVCFELCFVSRSALFIQPVPLVINFPKLKKSPYFHLLPKEPRYTYIQNITIKWPVSYPQRVGIFSLNIS